MVCSIMPYTTYGETRIMRIQANMQSSCRLMNVETEGINRNTCVIFRVIAAAIFPTAPDKKLFHATVSNDPFRSGLLLNRRGDVNHRKARLCTLSLSANATDSLFLHSSHYFPRFRKRRVRRANSLIKFCVD